MFGFFDSATQWILGLILLLSSLGVILLRKPVHASLSFLLTLLTLSIYYLQLDAHFISVMQVLVYAGAILVIFMFVIILFQDAYQEIEFTQPKSSKWILAMGFIFLIFGFSMFIYMILDLPSKFSTLSHDYGTVQSLGKALYLDFFIPFEAAILLFLVALIGALYIGKKVKKE